MFLMFEYLPCVLFESAHVRQNPLARFVAAAAHWTLVASAGLIGVFTWLVATFFAFVF